MFAVGVDPATEFDFFEPLPSTRYVWVLDALEPSTLPELGRLFLGTARAVSVAADRLLVAGGAAGVYDVRLQDSGEAAASPTPGPSRTPAPSQTAAPSPVGTTTPTWTPRWTPRRPDTTLYICLPSLDNGGAAQ